MLERHDGKVVDISRPVFLDIETTGLHEDDEIVEIAIADYDGREIMNKYHTCPKTDFKSIRINPPRM
ncbi:MAG: exonuclease domain-containing protein, partial [Gemmatimonadota bacterium]|nr:exonuclease domain-containing protein [Gemmatimonadota bacterium]